MSLLKVDLYEFSTNQFVKNLCLVKFGSSRFIPRPQGPQPKVFIDGAKALIRSINVKWEPKHELLFKGPTGN